MDDSTKAVARRSLWRAAEPLWVAALGAQLIVLGGLLLPSVIRMVGRGGAAETVEWAVYMSTLFLFPFLVWIAGWVIPRVAGRHRGSWVHRGVVGLLALEFLAYAVLRATPSLVIAAIVASVLGLIMLGYVRPRFSTGDVVVAGCSGLAGWMAAGGLVYWGDARQWVFASPVTAGVFAIVTIVVAGMLREWMRHEQHAEDGIRIVDVVPLAILVAFSFRTYPVVELYHWGFFVGPIDQLRQGGTLLWDTPSQYGFLSILVPSLFPGNAWQSFWFFQSLVYAIVACLMYVAIRRLSRGWWTAITAFAITFTTLFFRPRTASLLLPAQMTPAAGPFRFIWCFVMLAFLVAWYRRHEAESKSLRFAVTGTIIWVIALLWSAETAIYVSAMWFPAYLIHTLQRGMGFRFVAGRLAIPVAGMFAAGFLVFGVYSAVNGFAPDIRGYFEYVLLYSRGGFGALPIDPTGTIWYLVLAFLIVSTVLVLHALANPRDPRLIVWAAAWGAIWSTSSYFTGRSHPVNLIALIPILVYTIVACLQLRPFGDSPRARFAVSAVLLPLFVMPVVLTLGHGELAGAIGQRQLTPARFTEQVPLMEPELQALLVSAGAKPTDSFVLVGDGRLILPAWNSAGLPITTGNPAASRALSSRSWLPRAFEIIGSLPEDRRQRYLERNARSLPDAGWLIQNRTLEANGADHLMSFVRSSRREERRFESDNWIVSRMGPARQAN